MGERDVRRVAEIIGEMGEAPMRSSQIAVRRVSHVLDEKKMRNRISAVVSTRGVG